MSLETKNSNTLAYYPQSIQPNNTIYLTITPNIKYIITLYRFTLINIIS